MEKDIAILGAGKIGRGVVGLLFAREGYRLHLYDMYMEGMRQLEAQGYYDARVTDGHEIDETTRIDAFDIVDSTEAEPIVELLTHVDIAACCVYEGAFQSISHVIAEAVKRRCAGGDTAPLNVLLCVNALGAPRKVRGYIEAELSEAERAYAADHLGVCQVMVLAAGVPSEPGANPWQVVVSANPGLEIDADAWVGEQLEVPHVSYVHGAEGHIYRKVYCGNMLHAMSAFMGAHKGLSFICDCYQDPWIRSCITGAFNEAHDAVLQEYAFDSAEDAEWVEFIMAKLDAGVKDPIDRVMAGADEKLSRENRFVGPALMCLEHGIVPFYLARGIAYGLAYLAGERDVDVKDPAQLRALMADVCGLTEEDGVLAQLVAKHMRDIQASCA
ncbi:hypothetical protein [uncultured Enorma sp.]|uniref:mannitol dehydrogenase family protein n=1 Tax=uncultured Enorma sp. TaxID=1714346 RepID=UPI002804508A|nr:hypothetical protein [uncultured Enorma sp.]